MSQQKTSYETPIIFVTGASRSGTTMLSRILGLHSEVAGLKELHCFGDLCDPNELNDEQSRKKLETVSAEMLARSKRDVWGSKATESEYEQARDILSGLPEQEVSAGAAIAATLQALAMDAGKKIACEQTPRNIFYAEQLIRIYPNAKIIHMVRDPRDVLASQKKRWKRKSLGGHNIPYSEIVRVWFNYHPYTISKLWNNANLNALRFKDHKRFYIARFEDLVDRPEKEIRKMCDFLELEIEPGMLEVPQAGSSHQDNKQETTGISNQSLNRWTTVLSKGETYISERITGPLMSDFGYEGVKTGSTVADLSVVTQLIKYPVHALGVLASNPRRFFIQLQAVMNKGRRS